MIDARLAVVLMAGTLLSFGCGGGEDGDVIDWDLSRSHTTADVDWPKPGQSAVELTDVESVRIRLPKGRTVQVDEGIASVDLAREGRQVVQVQLNSEPLTADEAYRQAARWAKEWDLPVGPLESWYRERRSENPSSSAATGAKPGVTIGPEGPQPVVKILYSFNDERPSIASLQFTWATRPRG